MRTFFRDIKTAIKNLFKNKITSSATIISISATLFILTIILILMLNVNNFMIKSKEKFYNVQVFFTSDTSIEQIATIRDTLEKNNNFKNIIFKSKDDSMKEFKNKFGEDAYVFEDIENPLTDSLIIEINSFEDIQKIEESLKDNSSVDSIDYFKDELIALEKISKAISVAGFFLVVLLFMISLLIIVNTIKIAVFSRMKEINIMKYVGATNWYIRRPFIYEGMILGLISSGISLGLSLAIYYYLENMIIDKNYVMLMSNVLPIETISLTIIQMLLVCGAGIGAIGSVISMRKYLKV